MADGFDAVKRSDQSSPASERNAATNKMQTEVIDQRAQARKNENPEPKESKVDLEEGDTVAEVSRLLKVGYGKGLARELFPNGKDLPESKFSALQKELDKKGIDITRSQGDGVYSELGKSRIDIVSRDSLKGVSVELNQNSKEEEEKTTLTAYDKATEVHSSLPKDVQANIKALKDNFVPPQAAEVESSKNNKKFDIKAELAKAG